MQEAPPAVAEIAGVKNFRRDQKWQGHHPQDSLGESSRFGDKPVRVGIKSSNRTAVRWVPHQTFAAASQRAVYGFECRRRQEASTIEHGERLQPLSVGRESVPDVPSVAESTIG